MHSERDWIRLICENPTDTNLRLVYADWLDEHELHPLQAQHIRSDMAIDTSRLFTDTLYRLLGGFHPHKYGVTDCEVDRGFIKTVHMVCQTFMDNCEELFSKQPIEKVILTDRGSLEMPFDSGHLLQWYEWYNEDWTPTYSLPRQLIDVLAKVGRYKSLQYHSGRNYMYRTWITPHPDSHTINIYYKNDPVKLGVLSQACVEYARRKVGLPSLLTPAPALTS